MNARATFPASAKHQLGQLSHLDLLALVILTGAAPSDATELRMGQRSREQLIDALTRRDQ